MVYGFLCWLPVADSDSQYRAHRSGKELVPLIDRYKGSLAWAKSDCPNKGAQDAFEDFEEGDIKTNVKLAIVYNKGKDPYDLMPVANVGSLTTLRKFFNGEDFDQGNWPNEQIQPQVN